MKASERIIVSLFWSILMGALVFAGCVSTSEKEGIDSAGQGGAQITLYLNGPERTSENISFELAAVNITSDKGVSFDILSNPVDINSLDVTGRQLRLGERFIPEGRYKKIRITAKKASVRRNDRTADLAMPSEGIELAIDMNLQKNMNTSLFLSWNPDASVSDGYLFKPLFIVKKEAPELRTLLIYVTNEGSNNVSVINRQTGEVVGTILAGKRPRGITVNQRKERLKVYVVNSFSNTVSVIDPNTNTVENEVEVRFGRQPEDIAVARISSQDDLIFVANYGSDNVSMINASTLREFDRVDVGKGPVAVAVDPPVEILAEARSLSQTDMNTLRAFSEKYLNVYVVNKNSKSVSVLKINRTSMRCEEVTNIEVGWNPVALYVDYPRGRVYVANYNFNDLSVINIPELVRGNTARAVFAIKNVGPSGIGVFSDPSFDRLYLLKDMPGEIVIMRLLEGLIPAAQTAMPTVMGIIPVGNTPRAFMLDPEGRKIYAVIRGEDSVMVFDKTTRKKEHVIPVGKRPYGLTTFSR